jgi:hypothetical protein
VECGYWACIPSKTLLRPPEAKAGADRAEGVAGAALDWPDTRAYRDYMIRNLHDGNQVKGYQDSGAAVVVATGSDAFVPPVEGLDAVPVWTNREATTLTEIPRRAVMIGGSAVGVGLGLFLRRYGAAVTIPERSAGLLSREERRVGELTEQYRRDEGVDVRTGTSAVRARRTATTPSSSSTAATRCVATSGPAERRAPPTLASTPSASSSANTARSSSTAAAAAKEPGRSATAGPGRGVGGRAAGERVDPARGAGGAGEIPIARLLDSVSQFPTCNEGWLKAVSAVAK